MKTKGKILMALVILAAVAVGFLIGVSVEYPRLNNEDLSGTIGKVKKYNNTKATEVDIQLKDELISDSLMASSLKGYITFYYLKSLDLQEILSISVTRANENELFKSKYENRIAALGNYGEFLKNARGDLSLAVAACQDVKTVNPALLRNSIIQAKNTIIRMDYSNSVVLDFIDDLENFVVENGADTYPELASTHDMLTYNQALASVISNDKVLIKFLNNKRIFGNTIETSNPEKIKESIIQDRDALKIFFDAEKLGLKDSQNSGIFDTEKLGRLFDAEKLGRYSDKEKLGTGFTDKERLGAGFTDKEKLGAGFTDKERLGIICTDKERLNYKLDTERLGVLFWADAASLGRHHIFDTEVLGAILMNQESLGTRLMDQENLGRILDKESLGLLLR